MNTIRCRLNCSLLSNLWLDLKRARKEVPLLFEIVCVLVFLGLLMLMDFIWLNHVHHLDVEELDRLHQDDLNKFRKQFDAQMHAIHDRNKKVKLDLEAAHAADVNEIKTDHQTELEEKIKSIQNQLNSLIQLSRTYWEKHAEQHHVKLELENIDEKPTDEKN